MVVCPLSVGMGYLFFLKLLAKPHKEPSSVSRENDGYFLPDDIDAYFVILHVPDILHDDGPLDGYGCQKKIQSDCTEAVLFHEGHQKAEAHKYHHVYILEH
ncbi:hypothetical protein TNCV_3843871 [Trichonephila clavipes]|nr:hypothetical protein TNCV_3843871 [Trichonephila clavipes]